MERFLLGHACGGTGTELAERCLANIGELPAASNFGFVYATDALTAEIPAILALLERRTGITQWVGTTGIGICTTAQEYYEQPALAVMLASFPEDAFAVLRAEHAGNGASRALFSKSSALRAEDASFGLVHGDPGDRATQALLVDLGQRMPDAFLVGGLTSSGDAHLQVANSVVSGGVSGVAFSSAIRVATSHTQGCTPIAKSHVITAARQNILIELDGRPALDVFEEDVGEVIARDLNRAGGYIFAGFPVAGSDTGDYLVRNLLGIDSEKKLIAIGEALQEQGTVMFCRRDGNSAREDMLRMLYGLMRRLDGTPRGAIYHSCLGRGRYQFGPSSEELLLIRDVLGDVPLVGFFANGEIFHSRLYTYTGVLTLFC